MIDPQLLEFAKTMRSNATDAENLMWQLLRARDLWVELIHFFSISIKISFYFMTIMKV